jgi:SAM-dependent methyltransferase
MKNLSIRSSYPDWVTRLRRAAPAATDAEVMQRAIGGEFEAFGLMEKDLLVQYGLRPDGHVVDIGCGSGRLAWPLSSYLTGTYVGTDVVPELLEYARSLVHRPDWRFEVAVGTTIPEADGCADVVCFFSVFTHLLHEQSYAYLRDARRVLKPGGRAIFSFLEFSVPSHWSVFDVNLGSLEGDDPLNMFLSRDAIDAWANHLDLIVVAVHPGDQPHIELRQPVTLSDGSTVSGLGTMGQSVCVLQKP